MTKRDIEAILIQNSIRGEVFEEGTYSFRIVTENTVPHNVKFEIDMKRPAGVLVVYALKPKNLISIPQVLLKWYKETSKYIKQ